MVIFYTGMALAKPVIKTFTSVIKRKMPINKIKNQSALIFLLPAVVGFSIMPRRCALTSKTMPNGTPTKIGKIAQAGAKKNKIVAKIPLAFNIKLKNRAANTSPMSGENRQAMPQNLIFFVVIVLN